MKKITSVMLALVLVLVLTACARETPEATRGNPDHAGETTSETIRETEPTEPPFDPITVADNDQCLITITGLDREGEWGYTVEAHMENRSGDKEYMFAVNDSAVNGVQTSTMFASRLAAGSKSDDVISFFDGLPGSEEIGEITDLELSFLVYDANDWLAEPVAQETVHLYPLGEEKANAFVRQSKDTDKVLVDNENVTAIVTGVDPEGFWGYTVELYLVNKTDKALTCSADDVTVNGIDADPFWNTTVCAGKSAFASISWSPSAFEDNGIQEVNRIEMELEIFDANDWLADKVFDEDVTLIP